MSCLQCATESNNSETVFLKAFFLSVSWSDYIFSNREDDVINKLVIIIGIIIIIRHDSCHCTQRWIDR